MATSQLQVRIPPDLHDWLRAWAALTRRPLHVVLTEALDDYQTKKYGEYRDLLLVIGKEDK